MKLTTVLLLATFLSVSGSILAQKTTIKVENVDLKEVFKEIKQKMGYTFIFNERAVNKAGKISVNITSDDVKLIMDRCLEGTSLGYYIQDEVIVILTKADQLARQVKESLKIKGKVVDKDGLAVPGVTVLLRGTRIGTATDKNGLFSLEVPKMDSVVLEFSFVGMKKKTVVVKDTEKEIKPLHVVMEEDEKELTEVVVTGMFNRRKEGFTGSAVTVKGEDIKKFSTTNIAKALSAIDPSFRIMDDIVNGSNPNRLPDLRMRGQATLPGGSNAGTSADMVTLQGEYDTYPNKPLLILDGFEISLQTMVDMDPDRVESITLLKDAAATAIYGSRAANGVIVIESKTPKEGRLWVTYGGNVRIETPDLSDYNLMNAAEKLAVELKAGVYDNTASLEELERYQAKLREVRRGVNTYWLDKPLRTAVQHRHALTLEGGDRALRYKLYFGVNFTPGVMKGSKRNTMTGSLDLQYRFKKVLLKNSITVDNSLGDESPWGNFSEYTKLNPYLRPYGPNGEIVKRLDSFDNQFRGYESTSYPNPMYDATLHTKNRTTNFGVREQFSVEYNPTDDIRLTGAFSLSKDNGKTDMFRPAQHTAFDKETDPTKKGDFRRTQRENLSYSLDLTGSYNKLFGQMHYVTANVRMSIQESRNESYGAYVTGFPNENMDDILFGKKYNEKMTGTENTSRLIGWVGSFGYSYNYKYSVDFNIRLDGSSQFGKDNRFAPFWSAGLRWDVKKEQFMSRIGFVSDFVIRGSYGVTGTQGFAPYQSRELYSYGELLKPYVSSDGTGVELVAMPNEKLKWQQTDTWNLALELGILKGRITARAEYFQKLTKNSLTQITLAPSLGFASYPENMGTLENKGVELNISFIPYQNPAKAAYWVISLNGSHNTDKLKKISEAMRNMNRVNSDQMSDIEIAKKNGYKPLPHYEEGESINRIWVVRSLGIDPSTGAEIFMKRNGEMTGKWEAVDLVPCGNTEPKWQGNINSSFTYKGFGVNVSFRYKFGGQIYNQTLVDKVENADLMYNADKRVLNLRWDEIGVAARYKGLSRGVNGAATKASSRFIMDENTFQMGSLSLSYRMDKTNAKYIDRWGLSSVGMTFNMEDLFYLSTVKQERGLSYPFARQFSFSLNVAF
ncbi:SusC/RagA family TonB-linked outer membrane protein [uncultured Sanguibacteroides sp.]|uniref:SusC/RagA family TonB-linked outer membrane protein n=1 Tax=uncultured Sanguibacteroides sp. TaxID=1635151 RepID=UPI0025FB46DA|nr:SusC/RagA family TonB-linked outer membrane protein [uncultured Sanguibacteroides sp.]